MKTNKGITLVALILTIIVLLILAGVSTLMLIGEKVIFTKAQNAKKAIEEETTTEQISLAYLTTMLESDGKLDIEILNEKLRDLGYEGEDITSLPVIIEINNVQYEIAADGKITKGSAWAYVMDENGRKTIVSNGIFNLRIGTYINYNAAATNADETEISEKEQDIGTGTYISASYVTATETPEKGTGHSTVQTFSNTASTNGWKVLGCNESTGELLIVPTDPIKTTTNSGLILRGYTGCHYGEEELHKICEIYGYGYGATGARSMVIEDVNKITGYNPNNTENYDPDQTGVGKVLDSNQMKGYGNEVMFSWGDQTNYIETTCDTVSTNGGTNSNYATYGFNWFDKSENKWKTSFQSTAESSEITKLKSTSLYYSPSFLQSSSEEYRTLFLNKAGNKTAYWLASPYAAPEHNYAHFGFYIIWTNGWVYMADLYYSYGTNRQENIGIRPVVSLKSNIKLEYDDENLYYDII